MELTDGRSQRGIPWWLFGVAAALLLVRFAMELAPEKSAVHVQWVPAELGLAEARTSGRPVFYNFTADWCPPCKRLEHEVFSDPEMAARINEQFIPIRLVDRMREDGRNPETVEQLQRQFGVVAFPTVVVADAHGIVRARAEGFGGAKHFARQIGLR